MLALQRESHVALGVPSLSVSARITEVLDYLKEQQLVDYISTFENEVISKAALKWCDVLILSKHSSRGALDLLIEAQKNDVNVIYDIDDWIFSFPSYSAGAKQLEKVDTIKEIVNLADQVTVSNQLLLSEVSKIREDIVLVPNGIFIEKYTRQNTYEKDNEINPPRIVFTNADLLKVANSKDIFLGILQEFFHHHPEYVLDFYGDPFPEMFTMSFLHFTKRIPYEEYMVSLINGKYQFSITPLGGVEDYDSLFFNSCKNPFKYLNYAVASVPGIYSYSPIYKNCIESNETGILAENTKLGWLDALESMSSDSDLRNKIRINAFKNVNENHHIKYSAHKLYDLF